MPAPRGALTGFRPDLGTMFEFDTMMNQRGFIAAQVAPVFETAVQAGTFGKIPLKELLKEPEVGRNSRGQYNRTNFTFDDTAFSTKEKGIEIPIDRRQSTIYRRWFDFEVVCAQTALDIVLRAQERRVADMMFNATTFSGHTKAVAKEWSEFADAAPVTDVNEAVLAVWQATGLWPNALIINRKVFRNVRRCDDVTDMIASHGAGQSIEPSKITASVLASVFDLKYVIIAGGARDTANEGQDVNVSSIWSDEYALVARVAETDNIEEPCLARTLHWGEDGSTIGGTIETYYEDESRGDVCRVRHEVEEKMLYVAAGYLLSNITK